MKVKNILANLLFLLFISTFAVAQNVSDYEKMLTDDSFQEWFLRDTEIHLGETCTQGIKLKFLKDGKEVIKKECVKKEWQSSSYTWEIKKNGTQFLLAFGEYTFEIDFLSNSKIQNPDGSNIEMRLRQTIIEGKVSKNRVSPDKKKEVIDLFFNKN